MAQLIFSVTRFLLAAFLLSGCVGGPQLADETAPGYAAAGPYTLGSGDRVRIGVFEEADLSGDFLVDETGQISMPLIGEVSAAGLTLAELRAVVRERLEKTYLVNPRVNAEIIEYKPFYIFGEIASPGKYESAPQLTVQNAIAAAGGFTYRANRKVVFVKHADETDERRYRLTPSLLVRPGDTIRLGERLF